MTMTTPIFLVGGGKGGVGKSMLSMAVLDYLRATEHPPLLIETDTSAPDVWKAYKADVENQCIDLEQRDGWLELLDAIDRNAAIATVINTKAANQVGLRKFGGMLTEALRQQRRKLVTLWVIDRKRDGLPFGSRVELCRWQGEYRRMFGKVVR
jgi:Mrp family chromosome partitioning ATPase